MADDLTLERFDKKGKGWAQRTDDPHLSIRADNTTAAEGYGGILNQASREALGDPSHVSIFTANDPAVIAFRGTDDPGDNDYKIGPNGNIALTAVVKRGLGIKFDGSWSIFGEYDDDRDLLLFDLSGVEFDDR